jgi:heat shock protein HslJ
MQIFRRLCVCLLALSALPAAAGAAGLAGSKWRPNLPAGQTKPFVRFDAKGRLAGYGGCNHFLGGYETHGERIKIGAIGMSMMACEPAISKPEARFVKALENARFFRRDGTTLTLFAARGKPPVLVLVETDRD